LVVSD
jgi:hypothetical protein